MKYHPHLSHPGYGWLDPISGPDDPLIEDWIAEGIVQYCEQAVAAEREACIKVCEGFSKRSDDMGAIIATATRARGEK